VEHRFREPDDGLAWLDPVLVACPRCGRRATVRGGREEVSGRWTARLACVHCVLARTWSGDQPADLPRDGRESRFDVPLWLRTECCGGHLLWATNEVHLEYLRSYVGARLRDRPPPPSGLAWRLPGWMKEAGHRDDVLRGLARLEAMPG
jgi:hypothetical protein